jgi:hypothetical protein
MTDGRTTPWDLIKIDRDSKFLELFLGNAAPWDIEYKFSAGYRSLKLRVKIQL